VKEERARIVVAEDEDAIRENLARLLKIEGFDVAAAANGKEALALVREHLPALIVSDVMMPVLDGHGLLQAVRDDPLTASIPFIFLTARADRRDLRAGMNLGADDYLVKPFQRDELLAAVRARLARRAAEGQAAQRLQAEAQRLVHFDPLTNLPNRKMMLERIRAASHQVLRSDSRLALIMLGVEGLSQVNDSLGHEIGDAVLRQVADRLFRQVNLAIFVSEFDGVGRVSGDQFAILLEGFGDDAYLDTLCRDLLATVERPYQVADHQLFLKACGGLALFAGGVDTPEDLMRNADAALHQAQQGGAGSLGFFSAEMSARAVRRLRLHNELHTALECGELSLHYQAQVDIASRRIIGFEALMRWQHPELGFVSPVEFIPIAEESGVIVAMGAWALGEACRQAKAWLDAGHGPLRMAVNLSARQFADDELIATVVAALADSGLPPASLELEITESIAMQGLERTVKMLTALKSLGIALAMDDFGTGYSSLSYLKRFPLDALKVDQSFVRNITTDPGDAAITRTVVAMAHSFGMIVIAEGVETAAHLDFLAGLGCEDAQGYLFSKPLPATAAGALLGVSPAPTFG
jgi:diguanylate cyclase (GGDEF)-like protein